MVLLTAVAVATHADVDRYGEIQRDWFIGLNHLLNVWPEAVWGNLTLLGDAAVLLALLSPLLLFRPQAWMAMIGAAPLASALSILGKRLLEVPRPGAVIDPGQFSFIGHALIAHDSLPSGHAITVFAGLIAVLATLTPRPSDWRQRGLVGAVLLIAIAICLSRIAIGLHWPLDLLGGAALGWLAGLFGAALVRRYQGWRRWRYRPAGRYVLATVGIALGIVLLDRALSAPRGNLVLWLAGLCSLSVSFCLLIDFAGDRQETLADAATPKLE
jgi:membrane-associated phospholipid phosphatase